MDIQNIIKRNKRVYPIFILFSNLMIIGPVIMIYLLNVKFLSFTQIMVLNSISALTILIFEVPTGAFADKAGRKISLIIGSIMWAICLLIYIIGTHFFIFVIGEIFFGIGMTFKSGADSALLYDTLKLSGEEKEYPYIQGKALSLSMTGLAIGSIAAGFIYSINPHLPLIVSILFMIAGATAGLFFTERHKLYKKEKGHYFSSILKSSRYLLRHNKLKAIILYCTVLFTFFRGAFYFYQPYFIEVELPVIFFGIVFSLFNLISAASARSASWFNKITGNRTLTSLSAMIIVSFFIMGLVDHWVGISAIFLQQIMRGLYNPIVTKYLNKHIPSDRRATMLSLSSMVTNAAVMLTLPLLGILKDATNFSTSMLTMSGLMFAGTLATTTFINKELGLNVKPR